MNNFLKGFISVIIIVSIYYLTTNYQCSCKKNIRESFSSINPNVLKERNLDKLRLASVVSTYEANNNCNPGYYEPKNPWK